jgi:RNA polymerase sigma-70 factor, ECF subfamily
MQRWRQILALYDQLVAVAPTPVTRLNRAVAVAEAAGPAAALEIVDSLDLDSYYLLHSIRAELLRRLRRSAEAAAEYDAAIERTDSAAQIRFLRRRQASLPG